jgi:hypothetical protein
MLRTENVTAGTRVQVDVQLQLWMAFFRDPDRNLLALLSEVRG